MLTLSPIERRALRAQAHALDPVVMVGQHGLTPSVLHEIDLALNAHELIKVRVFNDERSEREAMQLTICEQLACAPVQHLGKLLVLWRPAPEKAPKKPAKVAKKGTKGTKKTSKKIAERTVDRKGQAIRPMSARQARSWADSVEDGRSPPSRSRKTASSFTSTAPTGRRARGQPAPIEGGDYSERRYAGDAAGKPPRTPSSRTTASRAPTARAGKFAGTTAGKAPYATEQSTQDRPRGKSYATTEAQRNNKPRSSTSSAAPRSRTSKSSAGGSARPAGRRRLKD